MRDQKDMGVSLELYNPVLNSKSNQMLFSNTILFFFFCPFWIIFMAMGVPCRSSQYIFEFWKQVINYVQGFQSLWKHKCSITNLFTSKIDAPHLAWVFNYIVTPNGVWSNFERTNVIWLKTYLFWFSYWNSQWQW